MNDYSRVHIDFETFSEINLIHTGSDTYSEHPSTGAHCIAIGFDDLPVEVATGERNFMSLAAENLLNHVEKGRPVMAWNGGGFEILIWNNIMAPKYGWPKLNIEQIVDPMAMAFAMSLPGSLDGCSQAIGLSENKDLQGKRIMLQLCKPKRPTIACADTWYTPENAPEKFQSLYEYCRQDVVVERDVYLKLLRLSKPEEKIWRMDWEINRRGVCVDQESITTAMQMVEIDKGRLENEMREVTCGAVSSGTSTGQLTDWLKHRGLDVPSVAKADVLEMLKQDIPDDCRRALKIRQDSSKSSTAKLNAMVNGLSDGRIKGLFQFCGAGTGRWAGRRVQLQNLPRPNISQNQIEHVFEIMNQPGQIQEKMQTIEMFYGPVSSVISSCLRGFLTAKSGHDLMAVDFSAIEARVVAWLAGQESVLEIFRDHGLIYEHAASGIFGVPINEVTKYQRSIGKVCVLALGFGGGIGAFQSMAKIYGVKVPDDEADEIKKAWRADNPFIVDYWKELENAAAWAVENPGEKYFAGFPGRRVCFVKNGSFLWCKLPSGRVLCYPFPKVTTANLFWDDIAKRFIDYDGSKHVGDPAVKNVISYMGINSFTKKWERIKTYGGKLCENVTQAVSACLLRSSMQRIEDVLCVPIIMHVHDEIVVEVPEHDSPGIEQLEFVASQTPGWALDLPMAAEGWRGKRYRK